MDSGAHRLIKVKLSAYLTNYALCHEYVGGVDISIQGKNMIP
jgi:hypothetical protein